MSEGPRSAGQADVGGEEHPVDGPASTGTTGAGDVTGSTGSNGHDGSGEGTTSGAEGTTSGAGTGPDVEHGGATAEHATTEHATTEHATTEHATTEHATTRDAPTEAATTHDAPTDAVTPEHPDADATTATTEHADADATTATVPAATLPGDAGSAPSGVAPSSGDGDEEWADAEDKAYRKELRKGFAFGTVGGLLIGAIVALLLGALVWPGYLLGPGDPQDTANQVTSALSAKDGPTLDRLSCKGANGQSVTQLSGQVLQYITKVAPAGPTTKVIDTEARTPVDVTLSVQGQTQTLPSELVLGESKGDWCLKGLAQRQQ
jgi:hypothetical protein